MSANLLVDLGGTALSRTTIVSNVLSGVFPCSGAIVGVGVDLNNANTYCNLTVAGVSQSGRLQVAVQCSDTDVSGSYTDPTSGLAQLPTSFASGGVFVLNSGLGNTPEGVAFTSGMQSIASGFYSAAAFQRTGRFARAILLSGDFFAGGVSVGFVSQLRTTGSGGGFSWQPQTPGNVNV